MQITSEQLDVLQGVLDEWTKGGVDIGPGRVWGPAVDPSVEFVLVDSAETGLVCVLLFEELRKIEEYEDVLAVIADVRVEGADGNVLWFPELVFNPGEEDE